MTVFLSTHWIAKDAISHNIKRIISANLNDQNCFPSNVLEEQPLSSICEIGFCLNVLKKHIEIVALVNQVAAVLTESFPLGVRLSIKSKHSDRKRFTSFMTSFDPALQLIALEEMTVLIKAGSYFPPSQTIAIAMNPQFMKNSMFVHLVFRWVMSFFVKDLSPKLLTEIYSASETIWFGKPANSVRLHAIQKKVIGMSTASLKQSHRELVMIHDYCMAQVKAGFVTNGLVDTWVSLCSKTKEHQQFCDAMESWMSGSIGPAAIGATETVATHRQGNGGDGIGSMRYFFGLFNCVLAMERQNRKLGHTDLMAQYTGVHRRAFELLDDPKLRVFAPILAMFPEDVPVPSYMETFLQESIDKIQRGYSLEAEHEW
jgi:hypothetical protein